MNHPKYYPDDFLAEDLIDPAAPLEIDEHFPVANPCEPLQSSPTMPHTHPEYLSFKHEEAVMYVRSNFHLRHVSKGMRVAIRNNLRLAKALRHTLTDPRV